MMRNRLKPDKRTVIFLGAALVALIAGGGALLYQQQRSLATVTAQLQDRQKQRDESARLASRLAEQELTRLKPALDRLAQVEQARLSLKPKLATLDKAQSDTMKWHEVLVSLRRTVPQRAWLTSLNVEGGREDAQTVRLNGVTETQSLVGETMLRLNATKLYQSVDLHFTQSGKLGERDTVEFEVAAHLPPAEKPKHDAEPTQAR